jgi:D-alanyl-D-alanine carboxypeptidase
MELSTQSPASARTRTLAAVLAVAAVAAGLGLTTARGAGPAHTEAGIPSTPKLQQALDGVVAASVPGAILLVREGDETVRLTSGYANLRAKTPIRTTDRFRIGSLTKTFVSAVILQLVDEGKLSLGDSVERWLPGLVPNGENITIRQLLNMKAGLYDYPNDPRVEGDFVKGNWAHKWSPRRLVEIGVSHKPLFAPGKGWAYCNTCYVLAGLIVEKATGNPIRTELQRRILEPLGLENTSFDTERRMAGPHAHGYFRDGKQLIDTTLLTPSWAWAAGAMVSTADDTATFYRALSRGQVVRPALLREMQATVAAYSPTQRYGLGLARFPTPCGQMWGNGGDIVGYNSSAWASKDARRQFVLFVNLDEVSFTKRVNDALSRVTLAAFCGEGG